MPGKTTLDEARNRIRAVYGQFSDKLVQFPWGIESSPEKMILFYKGTEFVSILVLTDDNNVVEKITFDIAEKLDKSGTSLTLADLQPIIGSPQEFTLSDQDGLNGYLLFYGYNRLEAMVRGFFVSGSCQNFIGSFDLVETDPVSGPGINAWKGNHNLEDAINCH